MRQINDNPTCTPINCCIQFVGKFVEMANMNSLNLFNPELGLTFNRLVPVKRELIWGALTEPELFMKWFCPLPWKTTQCEIDLHPGGKFETAMPYHFLLKIIERLRRSLNLHFEEFKIEAYFQTRFESVKTGFDHPQIKVNQQANQNSIRLTLPLSIDLKLFFKAFVYLVLDLKLFDDIQPQNH